MFLKAATVVLAVGLLVFVVVEIAVSSLTVKSTKKLGYAGEAYQIKAGTQYRVLYFQPEDMTKQTTLVNGTHIQEDSDQWTSIGYIPQKGDLVEVNEVRLFGQWGLLHGWGNTILIQSAPNK